MIDIFDTSEYYRKDMAIYAQKNFNLDAVFRDQLKKQRRYPVSAFLDVYMHDPLQNYPRTQEEYQRMQEKAHRVSQLTQKLHTMNLLEEALNLKL